LPLSGSIGKAADGLASHINAGPLKRYRACSQVYHGTPVLCARFSAVLFGKRWKRPQQQKEQAHAVHVESSGEAGEPPEKCQTSAVGKQALPAPAARNHPSFTERSNDCRIAHRVPSAELAFKMYLREPK
jgi:hypothetical protein